MLFLLCFFFIPCHEARGNDNLPQRIKQTNEDLKIIEHRIGDSREKLEKIKKEEKKVLQRIELWDQQIEKYKYNQRIYDDKITINRLEQDRLSEEIKKLEGSLIKRKNLLASRLRSWYKTGRFGFWQVILGSDSFTELSQKLYYLNLISAKDNQLIQDVLKELTSIRKKQAEVVLYQQQIQELKNKSSQEEKELQKQKKEKEGYLRSLRKQEKEHQITSQELDRARLEIQNIIADLQKKEKEAVRTRAEEEAKAKEKTKRAEEQAKAKKTAKSTSGEQVKEKKEKQPGEEKKKKEEKQAQAKLESKGISFASRKGCLNWPAQGTIKHSQNEGNKAGVSGDGIKTKGIIIQAPSGTKICCIHEGIIVYADWCLGYGKLLIVDHGAGYCSIYAHISEFLVKLQEKVKRGQAIAYIGETGAVEKSQLYFEIRHHGVPLDPWSWLQ